MLRISILLFPILLFSQSDDICGVWLEEKKQSHIEIYKNLENNYEGKIIWLAEPIDENGEIKKDKENPNKDLRTRNIIGLVIIKNLEYLENNKWANGNIYDARSGKTYSLHANLENKNTQFMRGYLGFSFIGKTTTWTRVK